MPRLLPTWSKHSATLNLDKEPLETFGWMKDPTDFEDMCQALKAADATEWLKNYPDPRPGFFPFNEPIAFKVTNGLQRLDSHSGNSVTSLLRSYQAALKNWDEWVLNTKKVEARAAYDAEQIGFKELQHLYYTCLYVGDDTRPKIQEALKPEGTLDEAILMVRERYDEALAEMTKERDERINERVAALEMHMSSMEGRHPYYRQEMAERIAHQKIEAGEPY
jgi:hypothetical protein